MNTLPIGISNLIFNFSDGDLQSLNIQVSDTASSVNPQVVPETNNETTPAAVKIIGTERVGKTLEAVLLTDSGA